MMEHKDIKGIISMSLLVALLTSCSINVSPKLLHPLIQLESGYNPYAIGVVGSSVKQPHTLSDFIQTISDLNNKKKNYSIGLAQINIKNLAKFNIPVLDAVEPCNNIKLSSIILKECYKKYPDIGKTLSCYYSGNDKKGFQRDFDNSSYVERFVSSYENSKNNIYIDFDYDTFNSLKKQVDKIKYSNEKPVQTVKTNNYQQKNSGKVINKKFYKTINLN